MHLTQLNLFGHVESSMINLVHILTVSFVWKITACWNNQTCFPILGCFDFSSPWRNIARPVPDPMTPEEISVQLYLYKNPEVHQRHTITLHPQISATFICQNHSTVFIIHGFASNGNITWAKKLKNELLRKMNTNVIIVDWGNGAQLLNYYQVVSNTRVVARELSRFIRTSNIHPHTIHVIGHSIGSHIAGYLGKEIKGLSRITALDPARPAFEGFDPVVRLDVEDAEYVEVVHTFGKSIVPGFGIGMFSPHGHVDFYVNGGIVQPGCPEDSNLNQLFYGDFFNVKVEQIVKFMSCSHSRSVDYFIEALSNDYCTFWGRNLLYSEYFGFSIRLSLNLDIKISNSDFKECTVKSCIPLGLNSNLSDVRGVVFVKTRAKPQFCSKTDDDDVLLSRNEIVKNLLTSGFNRIYEYVVSK